jgi:hypothetical protein
MQHWLVLWTRAFLARHDMSQAEAYRRAGHTGSTVAKAVSRKFTGETTMTFEDVEWILSLGVPVDLAELRRRVANVTDRLDAHPRRRSLTRPAELVLPADLVEWARSSAARVLRELAAHPWDLEVEQVHGGRVDVRVAGADGDCSVSGVVLRRGFTAELTLPPAWQETVARLGGPVVDGLFVVSVLAWDYGRPVRVRAVRAVPDYFVMDHDPGIWEWALSPAAAGPDGCLVWEEPDVRMAARDAAFDRGLNANRTAAHLSPGIPL